MRFIYFIFCTFIVASAYGQRLSSSEDLLFAFEVKQIDEFFERFNNQETVITQYIRGTNPNASLTRTDLMKSLINRSDTTWNLSLINEFIQQVNRKEAPTYLHFLDPEWYAEIKCSIKYLNADQKVTLVMKIEQDANQSSKWVIEEAIANFLTLPQQTDKSVFLNPVSQGTDFLGLDKALSDKKNIRNFIRAGFKENQLSVFLDHWKNGRIQLKQIDEISYHFLQIDGWIFKVKNYQRRTRNSGWLISSLYKANSEQKKEYKKEILQLNLN